MKYTGKEKLSVTAAGLPNQGLGIIAQFCELSFYHGDYSKRCFSGPLPEATLVIHILLLVSLVLVVKTHAPQGGVIYVFIVTKQKLSLFLLPKLHGPYHTGHSSST